jgi:NADH dehydrogenase FAD-containing subunit
MGFNRRQFTAGAGLLVLSAGLPRPAIAQAAAKVVIIGGGPGGAMAANQIKSADPAIEVTLIEPKEAFTSCFYSNLFIGGFRSFASITHTYDGLVRRGIRVVHPAST